MASSTPRPCLRRASPFVNSKRRASASARVMVFIGMNPRRPGRGYPRREASARIALFRAAGSIPAARGNERDEHDDRAGHLRHPGRGPDPGVPPALRRGARACACRPGRAPPALHRRDGGGRAGRVGRHEPQRHPLGDRSVSRGHARGGGPRGARGACGFSRLERPALSRAHHHPAARRRPDRGARLRSLGPREPGGGQEPARGHGRRHRDRRPGALLLRADGEERRLRPAHGSLPRERGDALAAAALRGVGGDQPVQLPRRPPGRAGGGGAGGGEHGGGQAEPRGVA